MRATKRNGRGRATKRNGRGRRTRKKAIQKAGFYPSVMAGVQNATLLTPVALRLGLSMWDRAGKARPKNPDGSATWDRANSTRGVRKEHHSRSGAAGLDRPGKARHRKTRRRKRV